mmetsp:Transcript_11163/g.26210  ORF Transcript_11163/g.26210 Transcript_11163/m.26210 type:complete len:238 (+) Transcript_11163:54-767(+)
MSLRTLGGVLRHSRDLARASTRPSARFLSEAPPVSVRAADFHKPSIQMAKDMPREYHEMSNKILVPLALRGDGGARRERMIREVMAVDGAEYQVAESQVRDMSAANRAANQLYRLPYNVGIAAALTGGFLSFPLVFDLGTALWFNEQFVTTEVASPEDLETILEVGSWTWGWMEPPMGQLSFFLLCLQWSRQQLINVQVKPYTDWMVSKRSAALSAKFPAYNKGITRDFSESDMFEA